MVGRMVLAEDHGCGRRQAQGGDGADEHRDPGGDGRVLGAEPAGRVAGVVEVDLVAAIVSGWGLEKGAGYPKSSISR